MFSKILLIFVPAYGCVMSILATLLLILLPIIKSDQYFESEAIDALVRCLIWLYFIGNYYAMNASIKNGINGKAHLYSKMQKNVFSFASLFGAGIMGGVLLFFLTKWSLITYLPILSDRSVTLIALGNGMMLALINQLQYFFLPEQ